MAAFPDPLIPALRPPGSRSHFPTVKIISRLEGESVRVAAADGTPLSCGWETLQACQRARNQRIHGEAEVGHAAQQTIAAPLVEYHVILKLMLWTREKEEGNYKRVNWRYNGTKDRILRRNTRLEAANPRHSPYGTPRHPQTDAADEKGRRR